MDIENLGAVGMAALFPEVAEKVGQVISAEDLRAIEAGAVGLGFEILLRGSTVEVACKLHREGACEQLFTVSRTLAPAAQA